MKKVIAFSDLFLEDFGPNSSLSEIDPSLKSQHPGGAELHDNVVFEYFRSMGCDVLLKHSFDTTPEFVKDNSDCLFFVSNFSLSKPDTKAAIYNNCDYVIYEHDYKFLKNRNPIDFPNFVAPPLYHTNINFYRRAKKIICLSKMHRDIFDRNLNLPNITNINCSMWSDEHLEILAALANQQKTKPCAVLGTQNPTKRSSETKKFCEDANIDHEIVFSADNFEFLKKLSEFESLAFMTSHPEPTPRIIMEAKMLNCKIIAQKDLIGVAHEDYFDMNGKKLIQKVRELRDAALQEVIQPLVMEEE